MERTELVEKFDTETGCSLERARKTGKVALLKAEYIKWLEAQIPTGDKIAVSAEYLRGLEDKAEAYDRLMGGGRKTLKEWANIFGKPVVDSDGTILVFSSIPSYEGGYSQEGEFVDEWVGEVIAHIDCEYEGEFVDEITLPDGWEEK